MAEHDYFDDVADQLDGAYYGILEGLGAVKQFQIDDAVTMEGPVMQLFCKNCGARNRVIIDWREAIAVMESMIPSTNNKPWDFNPRAGGFNPPHGCGSCGKSISELNVTPDQCARWVQSAVRSNLLHPQFVAQHQQHYRQMKQGHQQLAPHPYQR